MAMLALGGLFGPRRVLAMHFHHTGVKPVWQWRLIYRVALRRFRAITFPSDFVRREAERMYPPVAKLARTIRNPLPLPDLATSSDRRAARLAIGLPAGAPVIGNAGWLIQRKRFDVFLHVAALVHAAMPEAEFLIAGNGPQRTELVALADRLGVGSKVHWLGWQEDLTHFYRSLDVLVFNSDWDAFPTTPLEAMAHGLPVVASLVNGGLEEVMGRNGDVGFLLPTHDVDRLARMVMDLLCKPATRRMTADRARERVSKMCSVDTCVTAVERLLL